MDNRIIFGVGFIILSVFVFLFFRTFDVSYLLKQGGKMIGREESFCFDTDEGLFFYDKGIVYGKSSVGMEFKYYDSCKDDNVLEEWECINLQPVPNTHECPGGCFNGACKI